MVTAGCVDCYLKNSYQGLHSEMILSKHVYISFIVTVVSMLVGY